MTTNDSRDEICFDYSCYLLAWPHRKTDCAEEREPAEPVRCRPERSSKEHQWEVVPGSDGVLSKCLRCGLVMPS